MHLVTMLDGAVWKQPHYFRTFLLRNSLTREALSSSTGADISKVELVCLHGYGDIKFQYYACADKYNRYESACFGVIRLIRVRG